MWFDFVNEKCVFEFFINYIIFIFVIFFFIRDFVYILCIIEFFFNKRESFIDLSMSFVFDYGIFVYYNINEVYLLMMCVYCK